jgi:protoporphyrinogen oxidase
VTSKPHVVILGAGPAGLGAAYRLAQRGDTRVTVLERNTTVGGNAGSFELAGIRVDYGSHRLHPACDPQVLRDIRALLGPDLVERPRHGRISLRDRWIHFPLKPVDLCMHLPSSFTVGVAADMCAKLRSLPLKRAGADEESFASVLQAGLGQTICREFYFPYARKIWGVEPDTLSAIQARRRVSAGSLSRMFRKVAAAVPGLKPAGAGRFFYPRRGYGQISEAYCAAARQAGAEIVLGANVQEICRGDHPPHRVTFERDGKSATLQADLVWSTVPITALSRTLKPGPPTDLLGAVEKLRFRAMILIYLVLEQARFSEYDAHYFPGENIRITRLSEPKNYSANLQPLNRTVLCAELPCGVEDAEWRMSDDELGRLVCDGLKTAGIPVRAPVLEIVTRRLRQAYPIYHRGYETHFERLDCWLGRIDGLLTFGRQGLFAHDNTHHALYMAYCAADCLVDARFDHTRWAAYRRIFESHVVED